MDIMQAIKERHSVRNYTGRKIEADVLSLLQKEIDCCNRESGLHIQLIINEPDAFGGFMAHYGKLSNVENYIALVGKKSRDFQENCGYYGERIVLRATQLGLNTCWVALNYSKGKSACDIGKNEKLCCVIALGYGESQGNPRSTRPITALCDVAADAMPSWFLKGMEAVQLAPTAMNQQRFLFSLDGSIVTARALAGFYTKLDLGIVKYHFEIGASGGNWNWGN